MVQKYSRLLSFAIQGLRSCKSLNVSRFNTLEGGPVPVFVASLLIINHSRLPLWNKLYKGTILAQLEGALFEPTVIIQIIPCGKLSKTVSGIMVRACLQRMIGKVHHCQRYSHVLLQYQDQTLSDHVHVAHSISVNIYEQTLQPFSFQQYCSTVLQL